MKILYISNEYPPETGFGGIGTYTKHAAEGMASRGHCVYVLSRSLTSSQRYSQNGVTIHRIPPGKFPLPEGKLWYPFRMLCYKLLPHSLERIAWAEAVRDGVKEFLDNGIFFDIIEYPECGAEGFLIPEQNGKLVARLHTPWHIIRKLNKIKEPPADHLILPALEKKSVLKADMVTCPSAALAHIISRQWKCNPIKVINNPIPFDNYKRTEGGGGWIYTGRVEMRKGVHLLIQAYSALCKTHSPPLLKLIGRPYGNLKDGTSYGDWIKNLITLSGLQNRIEWIEGLSLSGVHQHLLRSSVAFFPSLWENFPYTSLEAMACGLLVVASDCGGYPEMLEQGKCGILVKPDSTEDLVRAMRQILDTPDLTKRFGENARKRVRNFFNIEGICKSMEDLYMGIAQEKI